MECSNLLDLLANDTDTECWASSVKLKLLDQDEGRNP